MNYQVYIDSRPWQRLRVRILKRDRNQCTKCGRKHELDVHHLNYDQLGQEQEEDVVTLCRRCHRDEHYYADYIEPTEKMLAKQRWVTEEEYQIEKMVLAGKARKK